MKYTVLNYIELNQNFIMISKQEKKINNKLIIFLKILRFIYIYFV